MQCLIVAMSWSCQVFLRSLFGKVQIKTQAAGLAVVRSPVGGYKDMIEDGVNGLLFKSEDAKDLARQLFVLRGDPSLWARIAMQGQQRCLSF